MVLFWYQHCTRKIQDQTSRWDPGGIGSTRESAAGLEHKETSVFHVTRVLECPVVGKGGKQEVRKT